MPGVINTDKAGCYGAAIAELKEEGKLARDTEHRQVKYLNNIIEADHGKLKRLIKPTLGFKSMKTAHATLKGFETMLALKKGQGRAWRYEDGVLGEVRLIERVFGLGESALATVTKKMQALIHSDPEFAAYAEKLAQEFLGPPLPSTI